MEIDEKILKLLFKHLFVYENSITKYTWDFDKRGEPVRKQCAETEYYLDFGDYRERITLDEYNEFMRIESFIKYGE